MIDPTHDPRVALEITRYHTWKRHRDQSVGEHSAQIIRILVTIWPTAPRRMIIYAVLHDIGEMAGDVPYPHKKNDAVLKKHMDMAERGVREKMSSIWDQPFLPSLTHYEERVFKMMDCLESWEYSIQEMNMGNEYARVMATRMILAASNILEGLEPTDGHPDIRAATKRYCDQRQKQESDYHGEQRHEASDVSGRREGAGRGDTAKQGANVSG